jgi:hypothetical protein
MRGEDGNVKGLKLKPGPGLWVEATWPGGKAWARYELDDDNKITRLAEIRVPNPTGDVLRRTPVGTIETAAAAHLELALALAIKRFESVPPDLADADFIGTGVSPRPRYRLKRPAGRRLDDTFYKNVGRAYRDAAARGLDPRQTLASDTGAKPDTVAAWVKEARRRVDGAGRPYLRPAQQGKVSA